MLLGISKYDSLGHGISDASGDMYLSPSEIDAYLPSRRGFNFNEFTKLIQSSIAGRKIIILDCYSGAAKVSKGHEDDSAKLGTAAIEQQFNTLEYGEGVSLMGSQKNIEHWKQDETDCS